MHKSEITRRCVFTGSELKTPKEEIEGMTEEEIKVKAYIENYTVALYKEHLEDPDYIKPYGRGRGKYYYGLDVELVMLRTFEEVQEIFGYYFERYNWVFNCRPIINCNSRNYFFHPGGGSVVGWSNPSDLVARFQYTFYLSRKSDRKKRVYFLRGDRGQLLRW